MCGICRPLRIYTRTGPENVGFLRRRYRTYAPNLRSCLRHVHFSRVTNGDDREGKAANYRLVQELAEEFKKRNGALNCSELLGLKEIVHTDPLPEARTSRYYTKRPCIKLVEEAARIWAEYLEKQQ